MLEQTFYFILEQLYEVMNLSWRKNFHKSLKASGSQGQLVGQTYRFRTFYAPGTEIRPKVGRKSLVSKYRRNFSLACSFI
jgi:hypothetical protein